MKEITKTSGTVSGRFYRMDVAEQSGGCITGVDGSYLEKRVIRNTSKNGLVYHYKPLKSTSSCFKGNHIIKVKILKGKLFKIIFIGFKAYEKIFDQVAQIACIYEDNNKNNFC